MQELLHSNIQGDISNPAVIVMHGYFGMSDNWKTFAKSLSDQGFCVHVLDLRNHGRSFHSEIWNYEVMVEDVRVYMMEYNIDSAVILGHSMGGKLAMRLATTYPKLVQKLIVADIAPRYYAPHHQEILSALQKVDFSQNITRSDVEKILIEANIDVATRMFLMKSLYWQTKEKLAFRFNLSVFTIHPDVVGEALPESAFYNGETLFINGGASNYITIKDQPLILAHFPNTKFKTIPEAGHWLHAQNPVLFYEIVKEFVEQ